MINPNKKSENHIRIILAVLCGLIAGGIFLIAHYGIGSSIAVILVGIIVGSLVSEKKTLTGYGKAFGFIGGTCGILIYVILLAIFFQISIFLALLLYFIPFIFISYIIIENAKTEHEIKQESITVSTQNGAINIYPKSVELDPYFIVAGQLIIEKNKASIGMLQRVYHIGFNRAVRLMEQLCEAGVVSTDNGTNQRIVLMSMKEFENYLKTNNYL